MDHEPKNTHPENTMTTPWDPRREHWGVPRHSCASTDYASPVLVGRVFGTEEIVVGDGLGRVAAADVHAKLPVPACALAAVYGSSFHASDTQEASNDHPVTIDHIAGGGFCIQRGAASIDLELPRGSYNPVRPYGFLLPGADAVLPTMSSYYKGTRVRDKLRARIVAPVPPGTNVIAVGADIVAKQPVLYSGRRITPGDIATLCMAGVEHVTVYKRPRVALCMFHKYFQPPDRLPTLHGLPDGVLPMVKALLMRWGVTIDSVEMVELEQYSLASKAAEPILRIAAQSDLVIVLGMLGGCSDSIGVGEAAGQADRIEEKYYDPPDPRDKDEFLSHCRGLYKPVDIMRIFRHHLFGAKPKDTCSLVIDLPGLPLPVMTAMYTVVRPILDALSGVGGFTMINEGNTQYRFGGGVSTSPQSFNNEQLRAYKQQLNELERRLTEPHPAGMSCLQGVRWFNGVLASPAKRDSDRHALQLARFDHGESGRTGLHVLPTEEYQVSSLFNAEAMVAIEKGEGEFPVGTPIQYFLLD